jgi:hypothetical protein
MMGRRQVTPRRQDPVIPQRAGLAFKENQSYQQASFGPKNGGSDFNVLVIRAAYDDAGDLRLAPGQLALWLSVVRLITRLPRAASAWP